MGRVFTANGSNASGTSNKSLVVVTGGTTVRPAVAEIILGNSQTPADYAAKYALTRATTAGTGTSFTPLTADPLSAAAVATAATAHSAEPTYTANNDMIVVSLNMRATFRYVASPGREIVVPATANNGLGLRLVAATSALVEDGTIIWEE